MSFASQLYIMLNNFTQLDAFAQQFSAQFEKLPVACGLYLGEQPDEKSRELIEELRKNGCPILCLSKVHSSFDGVHLLPDAQPFKTELLQGKGPTNSRHEALEWAEAGLDYVWFGPIMTPSGNIDADPQVTMELVSWWAQFVETSCVMSLLNDDISQRAIVKAALDLKPDYIALTFDQLLVLSKSAEISHLFSSEREGDGKTA